MVTSEDRLMAFQFFLDSDFISQHAKENTRRKYETLLKFIVDHGAVSMNYMISTLNQKDFDYPLHHLNKLPAKLKSWNVLKEVGKNNSGKLLDINLNTQSYFINNKLSNKALLLLEKSRESAMLAVEIFNKPLVTFKTEAFVTLMVNAWNKLFLAYFIKINEPYYEKRNLGKWTYDLEKCINKYKSHKTLDLAVEKNLLLCKDFRDYVEHEVLNIDLDNHRQVEIFQALLFNYEEFIAENFGKEFVINQSLSISLQFSDYEDVTLGKVKNQFIKYAEKNGLEEFINSKCSEIEKEVLESKKFKVRLVPQSVEISNTKDFDLELSFKESANDSNSSLAVVKKIVTKDVSGKDYKLMRFSIDSINKSLEEEGLETRVNQYYLVSINQMFAVNNRNGNKLDTLTQYCVADTSGLKDEDEIDQMKKVSYKYHIERYPKFILEILEGINYDLTFINKNRVRQFSHTNFGDLREIFCKYSTGLEVES